MPLDLERICQALSTDRLGPFRLQAQGDDRLALRHYHQNLLLSEALYPGFQLLEVVLRNRFEHYLIARYGQGWFENSTFFADLAVGRRGGGVTHEERQLQAAISLLAACGKPLTSGRVVAELNFGFWTGLLGTAYKSKFWGPSWQVLLPSQDRISPGRIAQELSQLEKAVRRMLRDLRHLRNRVFHHEPVWNDVRLWSKYQDLRTLLSWMEPEVLVWSDSTQLDRFPGVFQQLYGPQA